MKRFDFNIGAKVLCKDGQCGKLARVVIDPETQHVTDLIVEERFLMSQDRVLPISLVQSALEDEIYLSISSDELSQYARYRVEEYEEPATGLESSPMQMLSPQGLQHGITEPAVPMIKKTVREGIVPGQRVIEKGMPVKNLEGTIGKIAHVVAERENDEITHLVVRRGLIFSDQVIIPMSMVEDVSDESIFVSCSHEEVERLPRYDAERVDLTE